MTDPDALVALYLEKVRRLAAGERIDLRPRHKRSVPMARVVKDAEPERSSKPKGGHA